MEVYNLDNYTYDDYLEIDKSTPEEERYELIFGHIHMMSGASSKKDLYESCEILEYFLADPVAKTIEKVILKDKKYIYTGCYADDIVDIECINHKLTALEIFEQ